MRKLNQFLLVLCCLLLAVGTQAQDNQDNQDSKYLAGAVPEVNGKVVFTKEFTIPGMSKKEIMDRVKQWMTERLSQNGNNSRVVYTNEENGQVVGLGEEWIVFRSTILSLDRTEISYQLTALCQPEHCTFKIEKIRFSYREGEEHYTAEEWITDKYALNKKKTKLVRGLAKWRRKTVDFADALTQSMAQALSAIPDAEVAKKEKETPAIVADNDQILINTQPITTGEKVPVTAAADTQYKEIAPDQLSAEQIQMGNGKLVIVIGTDEFNMTTLTANAGGSLGKMSGKTVIFTYLAPDQPYESMEQAQNYTVRFYPNGQDTPSVILECKKMPSQAPLEGQPRMYIGEVLKASVK